MSKHLLYKNNNLKEEEENILNIKVISILRMSLNVESLQIYSKDICQKWIWSL